MNQVSKTWKIEKFNFSLFNQYNMRWTCPNSRISVKIRRILMKHVVMIRREKFKNSSLVLTPTFEHIQKVTRSGSILHEYGFTFPLIFPKEYVFKDLILMSKMWFETIIPLKKTSRMFRTYFDHIQRR